jgi:hypothetical protein
MALAAKDWTVYIVLVILLAFVIGFFVWAIILIQNYNLCLNGESAYCPQLYCDFPSPACQNMPYRPDPNTGAPICATYLLTQSAPTVQVNSSGGGGGG